MPKACFGHSLRALLVDNDFSDYLAFSHSKNFKFACCLLFGHLRIATKFTNYAFVIHTARKPCLSKICPDDFLFSSPHFNYLNVHYSTNPLGSHYLKPK